MPQTSVGNEDGDSFEYNECCKGSYMPQDSVCAEDGDSTATAVSTACGIIKDLLLASRQRRLMTLIALSTTTVVSTATCLRTA